MTAVSQNHSADICSQDVQQKPAAAAERTKNPEREDSLRGHRPGSDGTPGRFALRVPAGQFQYRRGIKSQIQMILWGSPHSEKDVDREIPSEPR